MLEKLKRIYLKNVAKKREGQKALNDLNSIMQLKDYFEGFMPFTRCSIRPRALHMIFNEIIIHNRKTVIEFGSGVTTIFLSKLAKERDLNFISIENDINWMSIISDKLGDYRKHVTFIHAPIENVYIEDTKYSWYSISKLKDELKNNKFDLVIIDGPSGKLNRLARFPAMHFLQNYLAEDFCLFLDDIHRPDELRIASLWEKKYKLNFKKMNYQGDIGIIRPKNTKAQFDII